MLVKVHGGKFDPATESEPLGSEIWRGGEEELPAAALATRSEELELGTWYELDDFIDRIERLAPLDRQDEVMSAVGAIQTGVDRNWVANVQIGQSVAAVMICRSVAMLVKRLERGEQIWVRVE